MLNPGLARPGLALPRAEGQRRQEGQRPKGQRGTPNLQFAICNLQFKISRSSLVYASDFFVASSNKNKSVSIART